MKPKLPLGVATLALLVAAPVAAQIDAPDEVFEERQRRAEEAAWLRTGYLIFGQATPSGAYSDIPGTVGRAFTSANEVDGLYNDGAAVDKGYFAEIGGSKYFRVAGLPPTVRFGLGWALSGTYAEVMWPELYADIEPDDQVGDWYADFRVGPTLAAALTNSIIVDAGLKVGYAVGERGWVDYNGLGLSGGRSVSVYEENSTPGHGMAWSAGAKIKLAALFVGAEIHSATLDHTRQYTLTGDLNADFEYGAKINQTTTRLFIGFGM